MAEDLTQSHKSTAISPGISCQEETETERKGRKKDRQKERERKREINREETKEELQLRLLSVSWQICKLTLTHACFPKSDQHRKKAHPPLVYQQSSSVYLTADLLLSPWAQKSEVSLETKLLTLLKYSAGCWLGQAHTHLFCI